MNAYRGTGRDDSRRAACRPMEFLKESPSSCRRYLSSQLLVEFTIRSTNWEGNQPTEFDSIKANFNYFVCHLLLWGATKLCLSKSAVVALGAQGSELFPTKQSNLQSDCRMIEFLGCRRYACLSMLVLYPKATGVTRLEN